MVIYCKMNVIMCHEEVQHKIRIIVNNYHKIASILLLEHKLQSEKSLSALELMHIPEGKHLNIILEDCNNKKNFNNEN